MSWDSPAEADALLRGSPAKWGQYFTIGIPLNSDGYFPYYGFYWKYYQGINGGPGGKTFYFAILFERYLISAGYDHQHLVVTSKKLFLVMQKKTIYHL